MDKAIFFCVDEEHADRMRRELINQNLDMVEYDDRYIMRITGSDDVGKMQLDNFINPRKKYPTIVTTSKLLTTGVDGGLEELENPELLNIPELKVYGTIMEIIMTIFMGLQNFQKALEDMKNNLYSLEA